MHGSNPCLMLYQIEGRVSVELYLSVFSPACPNLILTFYKWPTFDHTNTMQQKINALPPNSQISTPVPCDDIVIASALQQQIGQVIGTLLDQNRCSRKC
jgi:hypothetical protein